MHARRMFRRSLFIVAAVAALCTPTAAGASPPNEAETPQLLVDGLEGAFGSTVGPDGALYVTEGLAGRITRIDPESGKTSTFADCLPKRVAPLGGVTDVAFRHDQAYALVTLVGPDVGGTGVSGIYRIDGRSSCTPIADIGQWSVDNPPDADIFVLSGLQFAFEPYRDGFLVTDGHHNRLLYVTLDGTVQELIQFPNVVPTGLDVRDGRIFLAEAGPVPHVPETGVIVKLQLPGTDVTQVAAGAPLLVDVERPGDQLFGLAQGQFPIGSDPGTPANPNTGQLLRADGKGGFDVVTEGLDRPVSMEFIGDEAYVVSLAGQVWAIDDVAED